MFKWGVFLFFANPLLALTTLHVSLGSDDEPGGMGQSGDLRYCLNTMNQDLGATPDDYAITFDYPMTIQINGLLPLINNSSNPVNITIGSPDFTVTIDGNTGTYSGFFIPQGNVTIQNMTFQNLTAKGGNGGDGISGGGGGMGAGAAIYIPTAFLNGSNPAVTLINVSINQCSAIGGNGGSCLTGSPTGSEGGGGGGGFFGKGGSITTTGSTGGAGGGGFGGDGGDVTLSVDNDGGGGGGGGGLGSCATIGTPSNLGNGGSDASAGLDGNGYGLSTAAGSGGGGDYTGGNYLGGGGGGNSLTIPASFGGGGGGSAGGPGQEAIGSIPPGGGIYPSGGLGGDGGGGGGGGVIKSGSPNSFDGGAGDGGYAGGGGGGGGLGFSDTDYIVKGGSGGVGGGGGGGGVDISGTTVAEGGNSSGGGGGGGGGPSNGGLGSGGTDIGHLGGGSGGAGASSIGMEYTGGGGGGGSGLGPAIFVDKNLNLTIQALSGVPSVFNASNNTTQGGSGGAGGPYSESGTPGTALGNCIFLREGSSLTLVAQDTTDLLTLSNEVSFVDDTDFGAGNTAVFVRGKGTVIYNGTSTYQGQVAIYNANFKVNQSINDAAISVCRNISISAERGILSGRGSLTGDVHVNSGTIFPDTGQTLTLGSLVLNSATTGTLGSLVHITIDSSGTSSVSVTRSATIEGTLKIDLDSSAKPGTYTIFTASSITGVFDSIEFTGKIPNYSLSYLPNGAPTFIQFQFFDDFLSTQNLHGNNLRVANYLNSLSSDAAALGLTDQIDLLADLSSSQYQQALQAISPSRNSSSSFVVQNVTFMFSESLSSQFTQRRLAHKQKQRDHLKETALLADNAFFTASDSPRNTMYAPPQNRHSRVWAMGFGQFSRQDSQDQNPAFDFNSGGFLAAYDYGNSDLGCIGTLAGYAYSSVHAHQSMGSSQLNTGYLSIYGTRSFSNFFIETAVWGNYTGVKQRRVISFSGFDKTATSSYNPKQIDLHLGAGYDFNLHTATIEPFALLDWVFEWDPRYSEKGAAPYNMEVDARTSWMLRFETGLHGYNTSTYNWGLFIAQAKLSYVYKNPHHVGNVQASIVNAPASFVVEAFTTSQSLVSPAVELFWQTNWNGYASISYDGEFGSGYTSNQFYGKIGYSF